FPGPGGRHRGRRGLYGERAGRLPGRDAGPPLVEAAATTSGRSDPAWNAFWRIDPRPDRRPAPDGPLAAVMEDKLELIAAGGAVAIVPGGDLGVRLRPDLIAIPLVGVPPSHVVVVSRADDRSWLVAAFRRYAQTMLSRPE
ncbi:hypothetical protein ACWDTA_33390, partial [Nocardia niigatensis]